MFNRRIFWLIDFASVNPLITFTYQKFIYALCFESIVGHWLDLFTECLASLIYVIRDYTIWSIIRIIAFSLSLALTFYCNLWFIFYCWNWASLWVISKKKFCVGSDATVFDSIVCVWVLHTYRSKMRMYVVIYQKPCNSNVFFFVREKSSIWCLGFGYGP